MLIGMFADVHDHLAHLRLAVDRFNAEGVELVLFAGDFVSTIAVPPLRKLHAPMVACFGDNDGNKVGLQSGFRIIGRLGDAPVAHTTSDGTRFVIAHMKRQLRGFAHEFDVAVIGHSHKPRIEQDEQKRLLINPGETGGWTFGRPTVALFETATRDARIVDLVPQRIRQG
jgi:putative phosphoesterase